MGEHVRLPSIYIPDEEVLALIKAQAEAKKISVSAWVRQCIEAELHRKGHKVDLSMEWGGRRPYGKDE